MNWRDHIQSDPAVLTGKPVVRGTRLAADFLLGLFAAGWTREQVLESYPQLSNEALRAVFAFAAEAIHDAAFSDDVARDNLQREHSERTAKDIEIIGERADFLNSETMDALTSQVDLHNDS